MADQLQTLDGVLKGKLMKVADYQRPYAWRDKQLNDLWDDLDLIGRSHHYAGTLVLQRTDVDVRESSAGEQLETYEVVDGQQRLTTCLLLLDRTRRALARLKAKNEGVADAIYDIKRLLTLSIGSVDVRRLRLAGDLEQFWDGVVLGSAPLAGADMSEGQSRLEAARRFFDERIDSLVSGVDDDTAALRLIDLRTRVNSKLRFLVYEVTTSSEVGVLFETLNERGQALSELEKVKNYLLYLARQVTTPQGPDLASKINQAWAQIFTNLAGLPVDDDALLSAHWFATQDARPSEWRRTQSIKAQFPRSTYVPAADRLESLGVETKDEDYTDAWSKLYEEVSDYVETLRQCSAFLRDLHTENARYHDFSATDGERARRASAALLRSNVVFPFRPLLLAARLAHPADGEFYASVVELCEAFSARVFAICQFRTNAARTSLTRIALDLFEGASREDTLDEFRALLWRWAPDDAVRAEFVQEKDWYHRRGHKYVLYEYELSVNREAPPFRTFVDSKKRKTTEHVLPQDPEEGSQWLEDFGSQHSVLVHSIGNLVLTYDNSSYGRKEYVDKRGSHGASHQCYLSPSALGREREIGQRYESWTPDEVADRLSEIGDWALMRWRVEPPGAATVAAIETDEDDDLDEALELTDPADSTGTPAA